MNRSWRVIACSSVILALLGPARTWGQTHGPDKPLPPLVELVVPPVARGELVLPAGVDIQGEMVVAVHEVVDRAGIVTTYAPINARTGEFQARGDATLFLPRGIQLSIH